MSSVQTFSAQPVNTISFINPKIVNSNGKKSKHKQTPDSDISISSILHTTLELNEVLKLFFSEIQKIVACDSMKYQKESQSICLNYGERSTHGCDYRIFTDKDFLGEIFFTSSRRFSDKKMALLEALISQLVTPLNNALKYREAVLSASTDPLTGAGNRLAMDNALKRELHLTDRHNSPLSILMIDIDNFKKINDTYGHQTGDKILQNVAESIVAVSRQTDMVFRYGGEEFLVILNKTNQAGTEIIAERIRTFIENSFINIQHNTDKPIKVTVSIGTALHLPSENDEKLIKRADDALFKAKKNGKNQVICA